MGNAESLSKIAIGLVVLMFIIFSILGVAAYINAPTIITPESLKKSIDESKQDLEKNMLTTSNMCTQINCTKTATGCDCRGLQGPKGDQGLKGEQGEQGPEGKRGFVGAEGPKGGIISEPEIKVIVDNNAKLKALETLTTGITKITDGWKFTGKIESTSLVLPHSDTLKNVIISNQDGNVNIDNILTKNINLHGSLIKNGNWMGDLRVNGDLYAPQIKDSVKITGRNPNATVDFTGEGWTRVCGGSTCGLYGYRANEWTNWGR